MKVEHAMPKMTASSIQQNEMKTNNMPVSGQAQAFEKMMQGGQTAENENNKLNEMIETIEKLKETLDLDLTVENLKEYKEAVRSFLQHYTQNELQMKEHFLRDRRGYEQKLSMVEAVDEKLNDLTENMLETNQGHLDTLRRIGEINGLIINLYY